MDLLRQIGQNFFAVTGQLEVQGLAVPVTGAELYNMHQRNTQFQQRELLQTLLIRRIEQAFQDRVGKLHRLFAAALCAEQVLILQRLRTVYLNRFSAVLAVRCGNEAALCANTVLVKRNCIVAAILRPHPGKRIFQLPVGRD